MSNLIQTRPGAHGLSYAKGFKFQNVYIGGGHKYSSKPYSPPQPPTAQVEFAIDESVTETVDPTREEEEIFEAENNAKEEDEEDEDED